jgi:ketosteroid isomerase-like protein
MHRCIVLVVLAVACDPSPSKAPTTGTGNAEQELARLERDWGEALGRGDTAFFNRVMADDFLQTGGAKTGTKQDFLKSLSGPSNDDMRSELSETVIRQYGPAAVVTGLVTFPSQHRQSRYTEVWTKESGQWRVHHGHYNDLPPAAGSKRGADGDTLPELRAQTKR